MAFELNLLFCRGHTVKAVTESFQMAKDAGFKVVAHMMPDLPNVGWERDVEQFIVRNIEGRQLCHCQFQCYHKTSRLISKKWL